MKVNGSFLVFCLLAMAVALMVATPASATSCSEDCGGECTGGCSINSIDCSVSCVGGGCPGDVTCSEYGGTAITCFHSVSHKCEKGEEGLPGGPDTQGLRVVPQSEWAVLKYRTDQVRPVSDVQVELIAASTPRYGGVAVDQLVRSSREQFDLRMEVRQRSLARGDTAVALPPKTRPVVERVRFAVDTAGPCERVKVVMPSEAPDNVRGGAFFRVIAGADGAVSAVSPLYVEPGADLKALAEFLRKEGRLLTPSPTPIEAFVYLRANDAGVSYIAGSGSRLF